MNLNPYDFDIKWFIKKNLIENVGTVSTEKKGFRFITCSLFQLDFLASSENSIIVCRNLVCGDSLIKAHVTLNIFAHNIVIKRYCNI